MGGRPGALRTGQLVGQGAGVTAARDVLNRKTIAIYAIGSVGTGGFSTLPGLILVYYLTDTLGVAPLAAGILVGVAKVWDVLVDPVVGFYSDRQLARRGSRRGFMLLGGLILPLFFVVTFATPASLAPVFSAVWVFLAFICADTAFALFQVPYIAIPAELSEDYDQRTRLLTWRVVVLSFAILLFGGGGSALRRLGGGDPYLGYLIMAVAAGVTIGIGLVISSFVAPGNVPEDKVGHATGSSLREHYMAGLHSLRDSQPFRALLLAYVLQTIAVGEMLAGGNYVATWVLGNPHALSLLFVAMIAPALVVTPLWGMVSRHVGKERGYLYASCLYGAGAVSMVALIWAPGTWIYLPLALCGAGYSGMQSLPMAMLPDVISDDAKSHGPGRAGIFGGMWTAGETVGFALGAVVLSAVLAATGYMAHSGSAQVVQSAESVMGVVLSFSAIPAALILVSLVPLLRYHLRKEDVDVRGSW